MKEDACNLVAVRVVPRVILKRVPRFVEGRGERMAVRKKLQRPESIERSTQYPGYQSIRLYPRERLDVVGEDGTSRDGIFPSPVRTRLLTAKSHSHTQVSPVDKKLRFQLYASVQCVISSDTIPSSSCPPVVRSGTRWKRAWNTAEGKHAMGHERIRPRPLCLCPRGC